MPESRNRWVRCALSAGGAVVPRASWRGWLERRVRVVVADWRVASARRKDCDVFEEHTRRAHSTAPVPRRARDSSHKMSLRVQSRHLSVIAIPRLSRFVNCCCETGCLTLQTCPLFTYSGLHQLRERRGRGGYQRPTDVPMIHPRDRSTSVPARRRPVGRRGVEPVRPGSGPPRRARRLPMPIASCAPVQCSLGQAVIAAR